MSLKTHASGRLQGLRQVWGFDNRWELIVHRMLFRKTGMVTYRKGHLELIVDHQGGDENGTRECLATDMYTKILPEMKLTGGINVIDIGANGGGFPLMLSVEGLKIRKIAAVEMNPRTFARMQLNVVQNLDAIPVLINAAICGAPDTLHLDLGRGSTGESVGGPQDSSTRSYVIEGMTFDEIYWRAFDGEIVDLCKVDIEGAEYDVFAGDGCGALARCRYLIIEIHDVPAKNPEDVMRRIVMLGFAELPGSRQSHNDVYCYVNIRLGAESSGATVARHLATDAS